MKKDPGCSDRPRTPCVSCRSVDTTLCVCTLPRGFRDGCVSCETQDGLVPELILGFRRDSLRILPFEVACPVSTCSLEAEEAEIGSRAAMADIHVPLCSIVAFDPTSICYRVCGSCEQGLPPESSSHGQNVHPCERCRWRPRNPASPVTKHLYKLLMSIVTDKCAMVVVVFDRAARNLFGCPADDFLRFLSQNVSAVEMASKVLEGEMLSLVLRPPKGGYGQHLRAVSIVPLSSSFQPVMAILPQLYASGRF